ncbi:alkaline phosphatase family protein [Paraburkholderia caribensis]|uniref:alkaline phosphatase family protein n=1 Tax=Paraburkholderia caribensis TaxID=75105 RepID=UPI00072189D1|nr:alkaline phosphatase family protein [Paraburkholderia caribensis]ALP66424.1 phosphoesterase [Paraburkholderia caribensis]AUT54642.1 phosphoesterase [Paraburkholderia caribensis]
MSDSNSSNAPDPTRRKILAALAGSVALSACGGGGGGGSSGSAGSTNGIPPDRASLPRPALPAPATSGIDHIVLVTMENRSFDHMFGWVPNAEHQQARQFTDAFGQTRSSFALTSNDAYGFQACSFSDPNHLYSAGRTHLANGAMNGFLLTPGTSLMRGDLLPIGYLGAGDLDFYRGAVPQYTVCDYYMSGILSATFPNRLYLHSGETDRLDDSVDTSTLPTIWDRLDAKSVSSTYYFHDVPFTALYGSRYVGRSKLFAEFLSDAASGNLPSFCMVDPSFAGEAQGTSNDDHPHADVRNGQVLLGRIYDALRTSPNWSTTLMILVYDEWGGFMEHAVPPVKPVSAAEQAVGNDGRLGFRVPCMLLGPRVRANMVSRYPFDPSSIHQLLAWRFGLDPLGVRASDTSTFNMAYALDFTDAARTDAPAIAVTQGTFGVACSTAGIIPGLGGVDHSQQVPSTSDSQAASQVAPEAASQAASQAAAANAPGGRFADLRAKATALGFPGGM